MADTNSQLASNMTTATSIDNSLLLRPKRGTIWQMYKYLDWKYLILLFIGVNTAIVAGLLSSLHHLIIREMLREIDPGSSRYEIARK
jgi:hypothetical protein